MPVVGRGDRDDIDVPVFEDPAQILNQLRPAAVLFFELARPFARDREVGIHQGRDLDVVQGLQAVHVFLTAAVYTEHGSPDPVVGSKHTASCCCTRRHRGGHCGGGLDEGSSGEGSLGQHRPDSCGLC